MTEVARDQRNTCRQSAFQKRRVIRVWQSVRPVKGRCLNPKRPGADGRQHQLHLGSRQPKNQPRQPASQIMRSVLPTKGSWYWLLTM